MKLEASKDPLHKKIETRFTSILSYNPKHAVSLHQQQPSAKGEGKDPFPQVRKTFYLPSHYTTRADPREGDVVPQLGRRDLSSGLLRRHATPSADVKKSKGRRTPLFFHGYSMKTKRRYGGRGYYVKFEMETGETLGFFFTPKKDTWDSLVDEINTFVNANGYVGLIALEVNHLGEKVFIDESNTDPIPNESEIVKAFPYPFNYVLTFNGKPIVFQDRAYYEPETTYVQLISELKRMYPSDDKTKEGLYLQVTHASNPLRKIKYTSCSTS